MLAGVLRNLRIRHCESPAPSGGEAIWMYAAQQVPDCFVALGAPRNDKFRGFSTSPALKNDESIRQPAN